MAATRWPVLNRIVELRTVTVLPGGSTGGPVTSASTACTVLKASDPTLTTTAPTMPWMTPNTVGTVGTAATAATGAVASESVLAGVGSGSSTARAT